MWRGLPAMLVLSTVAINAVGQPQSATAPSAPASPAISPPETGAASSIVSAPPAIDQVPTSAQHTVSPSANVSAPADSGVSPTPAQAPSVTQSTSASNSTSNTPSPSPPARTGVDSAADPIALERPDVPLYALFDVGFIVQNLWNKDPAYDYFSGRDSFLMGGILLGVDALSLTPRTVLNIEVSATHGETSDVGPLPQYITESSLRRTDVGLGVGVRHHVFSWLAPHVRFAGAASFASATVRGTDFPTLEQSGVSPAAFLGGGLTFFTPAKRISPTRTTFNSLALRVAVEGGYQWTSSTSFEIPEQPASEEPSGRVIRRLAIPLGDLEHSGAYLRVAASAHF